MTVVWRIATAAPDFSASDLSGRGAQLSGGRWNALGVPLLYCADTPALACLETLVHLNNTLPLNRYLVRVEVPEAVWRRAQRRTVGDLDVQWDALPPAAVSISIGTQWAQAGLSALLLVPSVVVPEQSVVLINPRHADATQLRVEVLRRWTYDWRLVAGR